MNRIQVILKIDIANLPANFAAIVKHEQEVLFQWKTEGILEQLYLTQSKDAAIMILKDVNQLKARSLVESLPLFEFKKSIEFYDLIQQF